MDGDALAVLRKRKADYMREWTRRNNVKVNGQRREKYATNKQFRDARCGRSRMDNLRKRGGLCEDSAEFVWTLLQDPCAYCGETMKRSDRIIPGGASVDHIDAEDNSHWTNLTAACSSCNAAKGTLPLLLALLERQLRLDLTPIAEQLWTIKGRSGVRRRIEF